MSKIPGHSLFNYKWSDEYRDDDDLNDTRRTTAKDRERVMFQLGAILSSLVEHRFDKIGSLVKSEAGDEGPGNVTIGECLIPALFWESRKKLADVPHGPFADENRYLLA